MGNGFYGGGVFGEAFIGRNDYIQMLNEALASKNNKHISIYGLPHIGKTSILKEWKYRAEAENQKNIFVFSTVNMVGYTMYVKLLVRQLYQKLSNLASVNKSLFFSNEIDVEKKKRRFRFFLHTITHLTNKGNIQKKMKDIYESFQDKSISPETVTEYFEKMVEILTELGFKTVLCLDEFEHISCWSEDEYMLFADVLMRRNLNLFCVVASRPPISYVLSDYERKVSPFKSVLINSFNDVDMECAIDKIVDTCDGRVKPNDDIYIQDVLSVCGRNPYLLMRYNSFVSESRELQPKEIFKTKRKEFEQYFSDVVAFMLFEEMRNRKSFTHIIKCYFGFTEDYKDIIDSYINIGYIETNPINSRYSCKDDRYLIDRGNGNSEYYTTICPAFVNYLYMNKLEEIKDVRVILTGFVHSIRDITRYELKNIYANSPDGWNKELLLRLKGRKLEKRKKVYCYACEKQVNVNNHNIWEIKKDNDSQFLSTSRANWIKTNPSELIEIDHSSLKYVVDSINRGINNISPTLDPINLNNNGSIILHYWSAFSKYFGIMDYPDPRSTQDKLKEHIEEIASVRNQIQHFSRFDLTPVEMDNCRRRCIYLLRSIYSFWGYGIVCHGAPF